MADRSFLNWPFFDEVHRELADRARCVGQANLADIDHSDVDAACKGLVRRWVRPAG
jgi:acyl-CoA dehydrogenase